MSEPHTTHNTFQVPEAEAVAKIARDGLRRPELVDVCDPNHGEPGGTVLALPDGYTLHDVKEILDQYRTIPERRKGTAQLGDLASFIAHTNRFKDDGSALFASPDPTMPSLLSVLDYHPAGAPGDVGPRWGKHRGLYCFPVSPEWAAWTEQSGKPMGQAEFAAWLEARLLDVAAPGSEGPHAQDFARTLGVTFASPTRLLELSQGLSIRVGARVQNAANLSSGETKLTYHVEHEDEAGGPVTVPKAFLIGIPVFRGGAGYVLPVHLRYRMIGGSITWLFEIHGADRAFDDAFCEACELAKESTELPLFVGSPEAGT